VVRSPGIELFNDNNRWIQELPSTSTAPQSAAVQRAQVFMVLGFDVQRHGSLQAQQRARSASKG
jgi:hypothetical protein